MTIPTFYNQRQTLSRAVFLSCVLFTIAICTPCHAQTGTFKVCANKPFSLTSVKDAEGAGTITYTWYEDGELIGASFDPFICIHEGRAAGMYAYVRKASGEACPDVVASNTYTVEVLAAPTAPTGLSSDITTICNGTATTMILTASGGSDGAGAVYEWGTGSTVGENPLSPATTTAATYRVSPSAATTYWVRRKGTGVCGATVTGGATLSIAATTPPTAPTGLSSDITTICNGTATTMILTAGGGTAGAGAVYEWGMGSTVGSNPLSPSTTTAATYRVNPSVATTYWVRRKATAAAGACSTTVTGGVTLSIAATTPPTAPTGLSSDITTICNGTATTMILTANGGTSGAGAVYEWGTGSTVGSKPLSPATTTAATYRVNPSAATTYWVRRKATAAAGACSATVTGGVTLSIAATTPPTAPVSLSSTSTTICNGTATAMTLTANGGTAGASVYEWGTGSTVGSKPLSPATTTAATYRVNPSAATIYWVRRKGTGACSATITGGVTLSIAASTPPTITLLSGSIDQSVFQALPITAIQYTTTNATGAAISGQPANVSGVWASNTYTVSGTIAPSAADGTYGYRVSTTGHNAPCAAATASGSITVKPCNGGYDCEVWTTCGFTLITLGENRLPWQSASNYCTNKGGGGWRLPTSSELQCMQSNRGSLPGGCSGDTGYWSSASCSSGHVSRAVCMSNYSEACTTNATQLRTRCVR